MNQSELDADTFRQHQGGKIAREGLIGFGFTSDWSRKWREIL